MTLVHRIKISPEELEVIRLVEKNAIQLRQLAETDGIREDDVYKLSRHIDWLYGQVSSRTKEYGAPTIFDDPVTSYKPTKRQRRRMRSWAKENNVLEHVGITGWYPTEFMAGYKSTP